jgi:hypothetical protein
LKNVGVVVEHWQVIESLELKAHHTQAIMLAGSRAATPLVSNKAVALEHVRDDGYALTLLTDILRNDEDIVKAAVENDGRSVQYASSSLREDRGIMLLALKQHGWMMGQKKFPRRFRSDREMVLAAVASDGIALEFASDNLQDDEEVVRTAIKSDWRALAYASHELRDDFEIVCSALNADGRVLEFASEGLRGDLRIARIAIKKDWRAFEFCSIELRSDRNFIQKECFPLNTNILSFVVDHLRSEPSFMLGCVTHDGLALQYGMGEIKNNKEIVLEAVKQNGLALEFAAPELREKYEIVLPAVVGNYKALEFAPEDLQVGRCTTHLTVLIFCLSNPHSSFSSIFISLLIFFCYISFIPSCNYCPKCKSVGSRLNRAVTN